MKKHFLAFFVIGILLVSFIEAVPYDYMVYASFWAGTSCTFNQCLKNETENLNHKFWNVHGLWPDYWQGYPAYCDGNTTIFNPDYLGPAVNTMLTRYWSGLNDSSLLFHNHEWQKHGSCWNDKDPNAGVATKMKNYFSTVMEFALDLNIYGIMEANQINPRSEPYPLATLENLFDLYWKPNTYLFECIQDANHNQYLNAAYVCLDLNMRIQECPPNFAAYFTQCTSDLIYYLPLLI